MIVKDVHAVHTLTRKFGKDHTLIVRLFQVKDGCIMTHETRQLLSQVKGLSYVEVLQGGQSYFHVQTTLLVFQC